VVEIKIYKIERKNLKLNLFQNLKEYKVIKYINKIKIRYEKIWVCRKNVRSVMEILNFLGNIFERQVFVWTVWWDGLVFEK